MRYLSVPERLGGFSVGAALAVVALRAVRPVAALGPPCPLRTLTGVPCPLCGMTTAAGRLASGDVHDALSANPLVVGPVALAVTGTALLALRAAGLVGPPAEWPSRRRRPVVWAVAVLAAASWSYQLHRSGFL
jgi:hypothetical protein